MHVIDVWLINDKHSVIVTTTANFIPPITWSNVRNIVMMVKLTFFFQTQATYTDVLLLLLLLCVIVMETHNFHLNRIIVSFKFQIFLDNKIIFCVFHFEISLID